MEISFILFLRKLQSVLENFIKIWLIDSKFYTVDPVVTSSKQTKSETKHATKNLIYYNYFNVLIDKPKRKNVYKH